MEKTPLLILIIVAFVIAVTLLEMRDKRREKEKTAHNIDYHAKDKTQKAGKLHPTEEEHRSNEQSQWEWQRQSEIGRDRIDRLNLGFTIVAAVIGSGAFWQVWRQANIAQETLIAGERPWIAINHDAVARGNVTIDATGISFDFQIIVENVGHSPAIRIAPIFKILPVMAVGANERSEFKINDIEKSLCETVKATKAGYTAFPGKQIPEHYFAFTPTREISDIVNGPHPADAIFPLIVYGCFSYLYLPNGVPFHSYVSFSILDRGHPLLATSGYQRIDGSNISLVVMPWGQPDD